MKFLVRKAEDSSAYFISFLLVVTAGLIWSFGAVVVRYMVDGNQYQWQYLTYRGLGTASVMIIYLLLRHGVLFYRFIFKIGLSGTLAAFFLAMAMVSFIFSINETSVAVTLFMLSAMPFLSGIIGYILLKESVSLRTFISMIIALIGTCVMVYNDSLQGSPLGALLGFCAALCFSCFSVLLRFRRDTPQYSSVMFSGVICSAISFVFLGASFGNMEMPTINIYLSMTHGGLVSLGMLLYGIGAKYLPASELTLLSLTEVFFGVLWVALPIFGIYEVPDLPEMVGGLIMAFAIIYYGINIKRREKLAPMPMP